MTDLGFLPFGGSSKTRIANTYDSSSFHWEKLFLLVLRKQTIGWDRVLPDTTDLASVSRGFQQRSAAILRGERYVWGRFSRLLSWSPSKHQIGRGGWTRIGSVIWKEGPSPLLFLQTVSFLVHCIKQSMLLASLFIAASCVKGDAPRSCAHCCGQGGGCRAPVGKGSPCRLRAGWHSRASVQSSPGSSSAAWAVSERCRSRAACPGQVFGTADEQEGFLWSFCYLKCSVDTSWLYLVSINFLVHHQCTENVCLFLNALFLHTAALWRLQCPHQCWGRQPHPRTTCMNRLL